MKFDEYRKQHLSLNMARGKPSKELLDLSLPLLDELNSKDNFVIDNVDIRNYGVLDGLESAKKLIAELASVDKENVVIFGNSSLEIMNQLLADSFLYGVNGSKPWSKLKEVKFICVVPGYDRHFAMLEHLGVKMISVPMKEDGPDMDKIEELIKDETVKGIFSVPQYSNPTGNTYSDEVVKRFARLKPAAKDFRIYWDNAYIVHHLYEKHDKVANIFDYLINPNLVYEFVSTSKMTFAGGGIAALITSKENKDAVLNNLRYKTVGYDKVNQYRHVKFLKDVDNINKLMKRHAEILRPKFDLVLSIFEKELKGLASWSKPKGGYFITLYVNGYASKVIELCKEAGVILTDAGATFPYHNDPTDSVIRIAPSYPSLEELEVATNVICSCIKMLEGKE